MAAGITNKGARRFFEMFLQSVDAPTDFKLYLITNDTVPTVDTDTFGELTEIAVGNGYANRNVSLNTTDFISLTEDDTNDYAQITLKNEVWTASEGSIPASGTGAYYAVLTDDHATPSNRKVLAFWSLPSAPISAANTEIITLSNCRMRLTTV